MDATPTYTVFLGQRRLLTAPLREVLTTLKTLERTGTEPLLIFNDQTGRTVDFDLSGSLDDVLAREDPAPARSGPGRPKLGVVSREVSLLPRHWEWLEAWPNGASAALRRVIDEARKADPAAERRRMAVLPTDRFLTVMGGDLPGAEDVSRALYAGDGATFRALVAAWPEDVRLHVLHLAAPAFETGEGT
ncbi:hypothetical protein HNQ07_002784 [Deinococcus metalli]|uniref:DUF2239 family protein n=1 Tax=Deinococcus metalli TaxID=1141878 RepID=A0A7W8KHV6_9DEIO|nr:DUF2239 family protein [Deinococcus metalli]MBB5377311.1 hypothetical protein [Deinococcus metalli]GHF47451.1 hypothetical protein GCM10017781_24630 [Deinococcus metalli]